MKTCTLCSISHEEHGSVCRGCTNALRRHRRSPSSITVKRKIIRRTHPVWNAGPLSVEDYRGSIVLIYPPDSATPEQVDMVHLRLAQVAHETYVLGRKLGRVSKFGLKRQPKPKPKSVWEWIRKPAL